MCMHILGHKFSNINSTLIASKQRYIHSAFIHGKQATSAHEKQKM